MSLKEWRGCCPLARTTITVTSSSERFSGYRLRFLQAGSRSAFWWLDVTQQTHDAQQAVLAQHLAVGVARFDQCVSVADQAIAGFEFDVELLVLAQVEQAQMGC